MKNNRLPLIYLLVILTAFLALGCGVKGLPIAPIIKQIPSVQNATARLIGEDVVLSWRPRLEYSDGEQTDLKSVVIYRLLDDYAELLAESIERAHLMQNQTDQELINYDDATERLQMAESLPTGNFLRESEVVATLPIEELIAMSKDGALFWQEKMPISADQAASSRAAYAIMQIDSKGIESRMSNILKVYALPIGSGPTNLSYKLFEQKLTLTWDAARPQELGLPLMGYRIYKRSKDDLLWGASLAKLPTKKASYVEAIKIFGDQFHFAVTAVYGVGRIQSETEMLLSEGIDYIDTTSPDTPQGLRAMPTLDSVVLNWSANTDSDLLGYLLFRSTGDEDFQQLTADPISTLSYRDNDVVAGRVYRYRLMAIDNVGNRSAAAQTEAVRLMQR
jgi:hypothetical protein